MNFGGVAERRAVLVVRELRPGDIVLTGRSKKRVRGSMHSWLIRILTGSCFTHASIMMTRLGMLETNTPDSASKISVPALWLAPDDALVLLLSAGVAGVYRPNHRAFDPAGAVAFSARVRATALAYLGREYADGVDLLSATWIPFLARIARCIRKRPGYVTKWFCSSLVAQVYEDGGLALVARPVEASPGSFARHCKLKRVDAAVRMIDIEDLRVSPDQPPCTAIHGVLSNRALIPWIDAARTKTPAAIARLDRQLSIAIARPRSELIALMRFEKGLRRRGLI